MTEKNRLDICNVNLFQLSADYSYDPKTSVQRPSDMLSANILRTAKLEEMLTQGTQPQPAGEGM